MTDAWYADYWKRAGHAHDYADLSLLTGRAEALEAVWPEGASSAADVGCGRGELVGLLRERGVRAVGLDLSRGGRPSAQGSITAIPLRAGAVDLVMASEVLEHIPTPALPTAVAEMSRVARRWCLVTVPLEEQLDFEQVTCAHCRGRFNAVGHLRSVKREDVLAWFAGDWRLAAERTVGMRKRIWGPGLRAVVALQGAKNLSWDPGEVLCPLCGSATPFTTPREGLWAQTLLRARGLLWRMGRPTPQIGVYLFERSGP